MRRLLAGTERPLYLNLGSGPRGVRSPHWINVDGFLDHNVQYLMDFNRVFPFPDGIFDGIFCEHVLEHFDLNEGIAMLRECCRVMTPGGTIRIIMPNAEKILNEYVNSRESLPLRRKSDTGLPMDIVNSYFRQRYEHQCLYDMELARHALNLAGFGEITRLSFGEGRGPEALRLDHDGYAWESLYCEAVKPVIVPISGKGTER